MARLLLAAVGVLAGLVASEVAVRLIRPQAVLMIPDEMYVRTAEGYGLRPGFHGWISDRTEFRNRAEINSAGLRGPEIAPLKDRLRVLALGDSFTFGIGVEAEDTYVFQLSRLLERGGVKTVPLNAGVPGYGVPDSVARFARLVQETRPDIVIVQVFAGNDLQEAAEPEEQVIYGLVRHGRQARRFDLSDWLYHHSHFYSLIQNSVPSHPYERLRAQLGLAESRRSQRLHREMEAYRIEGGSGILHAGEVATDVALTRLAGIAQAHGIRLVGIIVPTLAQVDAGLWLHSLEQLGLDPSSFDPHLSTRILGRLLAAQGIPTVDLTDALTSALRGGEPVYYMADRHWTSAGHRLAAEQLVVLLEREGLL